MPVFLPLPLLPPVLLPTAASSLHPSSSPLVPGLIPREVEGDLEALHADMVAVAVRAVFAALPTHVDALTSLMATWPRSLGLVCSGVASSLLSLTPLTATRPGHLGLVASSAWVLLTVSRRLGHGILECHVLAAS